MKESYRENLASSSGHEPYAGSSNVPGVAWGSGDAGQPSSSEIHVSVCRPCPDKGKATSSSPPRQGEGGHGGVTDPEHVSKFQAREPGGSNNIDGGKSPQRGFQTDRWFHVSDAKDRMHVVRKSDGLISPAKSANKGAPEASAEWMEERHPAERNTAQANPPQAQNRDKVGKCGLERVREAARKDGKLKFVSLLHHADVDALSVAISGKRVNWILDADIEGFFDTIDHEWLIKFLEHRIGNHRVLRLIRKWLRSGIIEDNDWSETKMGTPQGAGISPLLSNIYLHYVFDLWMENWREKRSKGEVIVVRYADDFVVGFEHQDEAQACLEELRARFAKFGLKLHTEKTRLIEFGRDASERREKRGEKRPETFDFPGFTHQCAKTRKDGRFIIHRHSSSKRMRFKLLEIRLKLRKRINQSLGENARWLKRVVQGWLNYHAVPGNSHRIGRFVDEVTRHWLWTIRRRSQRGKSSWTWARMHKLVRRHLPKARIIHPYPEQRFRARLKARAV